MSHMPYEEWLAVCGDLEPIEREQFDAHLRGCPQCAARLAEYRAMHRALQVRPQIEPGERLQLGFYAAVARARREDRRRPLWRALLAVGNAAAWVGVAAIVAVVALTWPHLARQAWPGAATPLATTAVPELVGSEWVLTALNGQPLIEGTQITLHFGGGGEAGGFAGCNRYEAKYDLPGGGGLSIGLAAITAEGCVEPQGVLEQERAYTEALQSIKAYRLAGDRLELADAAGEVVLTYRRRQPLAMDPAALVGTEWRLVSWNDRPPIEGSPITIAFTETEISGRAGCRGYEGTYEAGGDHIRFLMLGMTEVEPQCSPELLQQEAEYTTTLGWTSHYRLGDGQLTLLTERGETLVYAAIGAVPGPALTPPTEVEMPPLASLHMVDEQNGWAKGLGPLLHTTDGGRTWTDVTPPGAGSGDYAIVDGNRAWVASVGELGSESITFYRTTDGGKSWETGVFTQTFSTSVMGLYLEAADLNSAWLTAVAPQSMTPPVAALLRTDDGGAQWSQVAGTSDALPYSGEVRFGDATTGWLSGAGDDSLLGSLSVTHDGGKSWQAVELPPSGHEDGRLNIGLPTFYGAGKQDGLLPAQYRPRSATATGPALIAYATHDGGETWQATTPVPGGSAFDFVNANEGWVWAAGPGNAAGGTLYHTQDGARTWEALAGTPGLEAFLIQGGEVLQLDFVSEETGWAILRGLDGRTTQLVRTWDGGRSWESVSGRLGEPEAPTSAVDANRRAFTDWAYGVSLETPAHWVPVEG